MSYKFWLWVFGLLVLGIFGTYGFMLGPLSHDDGPWSSFGSLLSGVFTLAGAGATIATLLFLNKQNQDQKETARKQYEELKENARVKDLEQKEILHRQQVESQRITQAQLDTLTFERYINHRRLFMDRLSELQTTFENRFVFVDGGNLYNKIFPKNSPTKMEFKVDLESSSSNDHPLEHLSSLLQRLDNILDNSQWDYEQTYNLVIQLFKISGELQFRWTDEESDGDMFIMGFHTGVNIYSLDEFLRVAKTIHNSFLFYTGNSQFLGLNKASSSYVREALIAFFINNFENREALVVVKKIPGLETMERLYFLMDSLDSYHASWLMAYSRSFLLSAFQSRESVSKLRNDLFVKEFIREGIKECQSGMKTLTDEGKDCSVLIRCLEEMNLLHEIYE